MYQIYRFAIGSTAEGITALVVAFLMWILERDIGLEKRAWDVLVEMGKVWAVGETGRREREVERVRRWKERQQWEREKREQRERDREGGGADRSLEAWMGETSTLRDDDRSFYEGWELDTTKLL